MNAPRSYEELLDWQPLAERLALREGVPQPLLEDFVAQCILEFIDGDYLPKFDPEKGSWGTFWGAFVVRRAWRDRDKAFREIKRTESGQIGDEAEEDQKTIFLEDNSSEDWDSERAMKDIMNHLKTSYPVIEVIVYSKEIEENGTLKRVTFRIERSFYTLAQMLLLGYTQREIAAVYQRSVGTVNRMISDLRKDPVLMEFLTS